MESIVQQYSERDIFNVNGDLIINQDLEKENLNFLKKLKRIDYNYSLNNSFQKKNTINRDNLVKRVSELLKVNNNLLIYGKPGIGKSFLLSEIGKNEDGIYVSFKLETEKKILLYLLSKILPEEEVNNLKILTMDDILLEFEIALQFSKRVFILDDCEKNVPLLEKLAILEKFENNFLFCARHSDFNFGNIIYKHEITGFSESEIKEFLELNKIEVNKKKYKELLLYSEGNPLYLFYYSRFDIDTMPRDLNDYQELLWNNLEDIQKEILICISLNLYSIEFDILKDFIQKIYNNAYTPQAFNSIIDKIKYLLNIEDSVYSLFHLSLNEFIENKVQQQGSINGYKKILGELMFERGNVLEATYLLIDSESDILKKIILYPIKEISNLGLIDFGIKLLNKAVEIFKSEEETYKRGYSYHHLSNFYRDNYQMMNAISCNKNAIDCFEHCGEKDFATIIKLYDALDLVELGKREYAQKIIDEIENYFFEDKYQQGFISVNLAKFYIELSLHEKAVEHAKQAYTIFKELNDSSGIETSLNNLAISYSFLDKVDISIDYSKLLLDYAIKNNNTRLVVSTYNLLTRAYRVKKDYGEAIKYAELAITISIEIKSDLLFIMNIINLGNVYKDKKENLRAFNCYKEGKELAQKKLILKEEVRALELMTEILIKENDIENANIIGRESLEKSIKYGDNFRIAEAHKNLAHISFLDNNEEWRKHFIEALNFYKKTNDSEEAIDNVFKYINIFKEKLNDMDLEFYYDYVLESLKSYSAFEYILNNIINQEEFEALNKIKKIGEALKIYIKLNAKSDIYPGLISFTNICVDNCNKDVQLEFMNILYYLLENIEKQQALFIIMTLINRSKQLIEINEINILINKTTEKYSKIHFRKVGNNQGVFTIYLSKNIGIQIILEEENITIKKNIVSIVLILRFYWANIEEKIKNKNLGNYSIIILNVQSLNNNIFNTVVNEMSEKKPFVLLESNDDNVSKFLVLAKEIENYINHEEKFVFQQILLEILVSIFRKFDKDFDSINIEKIIVEIIKEITFNMSSINEIKETDFSVQDIKEALETMKS